MPSLFTGPVAAPFTPSLSYGELTFDAVSHLAALLVRNGVSGAFFCGTTAEGCSLAGDERRQKAPGIFIRRASGPGALIGALTSAVVLYASVGIVTCVVVGWLASLPFPPSRLGKVRRRML